MRNGAEIVIESTQKPLRAGRPSRLQGGLKPLLSQADRALGRVDRSVQTLPIREYDL
ncbi:hypothetical protein ThimaDRAFT_1315 [Thiocapsa marina 5811]|uniref:Uncharacterized protein n=1 Tax=Thiocapsa marina 5811 TaxID=768671 RepID=F9U8R3_9GAMM|nr:hypothetical protein ThimaDRAFT_1315 [Thiocapsa marina 5811]